MPRRRARIVQINVWRPIRGPVQRSPLALADARSVAPEDLIATDQVFPDRVGEIYHLAYNPAQRWYYAPLMTPDEVLLIKGFDSLADGRARFTPHGAFDLPDTPAAAPPRESIEVRTLVGDRSLTVATARPACRAGQQRLTYARGVAGDKAMVDRERRLSDAPVPGWRLPAPARSFVLC